MADDFCIDPDIRVLVQSTERVAAIPLRCFLLDVLDPYSSDIFCAVLDRAICHQPVDQTANCLCVDGTYLDDQLSCIGPLDPDWLVPEWATL